MKCCFANDANQWFFDFSKFMQLKVTKNIDNFCFHLFKKFDLVKQAKIRKKARQVKKTKQQVRQARLVETTRLVEERRLAQQVNEVRFVEQARIEKTRAEEVRLIKKRAKRLLQQQIEEVCLVKKRVEVFACRRCNAKFSNNIKLHNHVQDHHQKKIEKFIANEFASSNSITRSESTDFTSNAVYTSSATFFFTSKAKFAKLTSSELATSTFSCTAETSVAESTSFATSSSSSESALMLTSSISQSKSIFDHSLSLISFATSKKSIFWVEIVSRSIIALKSSRLSVSTSKRLSIALKTAAIICSSTSSSTFSQKSVSKHQHQKFYLTMNDLFEMFAKKSKETNLLHNKKNSSSSKLFYQVKITFYFRFAVNQSKSINQIRKLQIREVFISTCSRKRFAIFSARDLRNRSSHHTKYRASLILYILHSFQRYRAFYHTNCSRFLIVRLIHLLLKSLSRLIATSQELEKYQELDLKKSSQVLKVELETCLDVKLKSLILTSSSSSSRRFRFEVWLDIKSSFRLELEVWLEQLESTQIWSKYYVLRKSNAKR